MNLARLLAAVLLFLITARPLYVPIVRGQAVSNSAVSNLTSAQPKAVPPDDYAGDQEKFETHRRTAHHLTSRLPDQDSILGKFTPDANVLKTSNPELFFRMDANQHGFFQTAVEGIPPYITSHRERFDLVIGSVK